MSTPTPSAEGLRYQDRFRRAVAEEIAELHAKGLSPVQIRDGYLVALQPDGQLRRLFRAVPFGAEAATPAARRT